MRILVDLAGVSAVSWDGLTTLLELAATVGLAQGGSRDWFQIILLMYG
jgi:hypothetical protein